MFYALDRFEEELAVLEDDEGVSHTVARSLLPPDAAQGDVYTLDPDGNYLPDAEEKENRRRRILKLQERLLQK